MITRVLFVDSDAEVLARIKAALEEAGDYEAHVFVTGQAALEYAAENPPAIAIISYNIRDISPLALTKTLRITYPHLPVLLRIFTDIDSSVIQALNPQGVLRGGYSARTLIPMIEDALAAEDIDSGVPFDTGDASPQDDHEPAHPSHSPASIDDDMAAFGEMLDALHPAQEHPPEDTFKQLVDSMRAPVEKPSLPQRREKLANWAQVPDVAEADGEEQQVHPEPEADQTFQKLAAEEPPFPTLEDTGTLSDLIAVTNFDEHEADESDGKVVDIPDEMIEDINNLNLDTSEQELLEALAAVSPPPQDQPAAPAGKTAEQELIPMPEVLKHQLENGLDEPALATSDEPEPTPADSTLTVHPDAAALAIQLTQHTIETAAQASILLRDGKVETFAGALPESDVLDLVKRIDWQAVLESNSTKIKFVALPESRLNFMVLAAPTVGSMVLVTVFPESVHLRTIRQQTRTILEALVRMEKEAVARQEAQASEHPPAESSVQHAEPEEDTAAETEPPEIVPEADRTPPEDDEPEIDPSTLVKYACAWVLRDPDAELDGEIIDALPIWLDQIITAQRWLSEQLEVQPDYISLVVSVPPSIQPSAMVQQLMTETAERILAARPQLKTNGDPDGGLWADAYYVVAPGRPLTNDEISRFISFQREG